MRSFNQFAALSLIVIATWTTAMSDAYADDTVAAHVAPIQSKHQLMQDCMAKEKASDTQMTPQQRDAMKKTCRDVTNTEEQNQQAEKAAEQAPDSGG